MNYISVTRFFFFEKPMGYYYTPIRMDKILKMGNTKSC